MIEEESLNIEDSVETNVSLIVETAIDNSQAAAGVSKAILENVIFFGKSLKLWEDEMSIPIPEDKLTPDEVRTLFAQLANKTQIASHFYSMTSFSHGVAANTQIIKRSEVITSLIAYYKSKDNRVPARAHLEDLANNYLVNLNNIGLTTKLIRDFWKERLATLKTVKECLSSIAIASMAEMKYSMES